MVEMLVAEQYRISHSRFLAWDTDDRDKAIALYLRKAAACPSCGTRAEEWDETQGGHRNAYTATPIRCRGCEVKEQGEASIPKDSGRGVSVVLKPNQEVHGGKLVSRHQGRRGAEAPGAADRPDGPP